MCLGVPGKVLSIEQSTCVVEIMGVTREISIELLKNVNIGDYVLIHAGCAIQVINQDEADKTIELFKQLKEIMHD